MGFADLLRKRRTTLSQIPGYAGGNLEEQLYDDAQEPPRLLTATNRDAITRPRRVNPNEQVDIISPPVFNDATDHWSGVEAERPRTVSQPAFADIMRQRQRIADPTTFDTTHLREVEGKPLGFRDKLGLVAQNIATNLGGKPLPTRRQRELGDLEGRVGRDLLMDDRKLKRDMAKSQMDTREAAILRGQEQLRQGDERLQQQAASAQQREQQNYLNNLIRVYNGQADFDPADPGNEDFVAEWERAFGYKPKRNIRGSQMAVIQGYRPDGSPIVSVVNKGRGVATEVTGDVPTQTDQGLNRNERRQRLVTTETGKDRRAAQSQAGQDRRTATVQAGQDRRATSRSKPSLKGRTISRGNFEKYKTDHGAEAAQKLLDGGVTIR